LTAADLLSSSSPQAPADVIVTAAAVGADGVAAAAAGAREAGRQWARRPGPERATVLRLAAAELERRGAEVEDLIVREVGKPRLEARGEVGRGVAILSYYAQQVLEPAGEIYPPSSSGLLYTERRPLGVAGLITPWNFPLAIPLWKAAPALAAGNAVLLKPSTQALACGLLLAEVLSAQLPDGLFTVLPGGRETAEAIIGEADAVSFTGSTEVGKQVARAAAARGVPVQAEMGGQNPAVVLPDADPESTARMLVGAAMAYAGQKCTATRRIITVGSSTALVEALEGALVTAAPGDPSQESVIVGPVITDDAQQMVNAAIDEARRSGATLLGTGADVNGDGWYVPPTVVSGLPADHRLLQEETFGPFAAVLEAGSVEQAVAFANAVRYGLASSVHGRDMKSILPIVAELETGMIKVNAPTTGADFYLPFGGEKDSSIGPREQGKAGIAFYSSTHTVTISA